MSEQSVKQTLESWVQQIQEFLDVLAGTAKAHGWAPTFTNVVVTEEPLSLRKKIRYAAPQLKLAKVDKDGNEIRIVFEPRHRYTIGAAGRIDVHSYPALREILLLRVVNEDGVEDMTWDQIEELVEKTPWTAYTSEGLRLNVDFGSEESVLSLLSDLTA